jgi:hypothetical protein
MHDEKASQREKTVGIQVADLLAREGEFLMTTLPVVDVSAPVTTGRVVISGLRR